MRRAPLQRKTRLVAKHTNGKPRTPLKKANPTRQAKRKAKYKAYLSSAAWKTVRRLALARACGMCEYERLDAAYAASEGACLEDATQVHHLTYARFGHELLEDVVCLCKAHHELVELRDHPSRQRRY